MIIEKEIVTSHEMNAVLKILSDARFTLPLILPIKILTERVDGSFYAKGDVKGLPVVLTIREFVGSNITYVLNFERPNLIGKIIINGLEGRVKIVVEIDLSVIYLPLRISIESKLNKLQKVFDELIRLERIKRKI